MQPLHLLGLGSIILLVSCPTVLKGLHLVSALSPILGVLVAISESHILISTPGLIDASVPVLVTVDLNDHGSC